MKTPKKNFISINSKVVNFSVDIFVAYIEFNMSSCDINFTILLLVAEVTGK